MVKPEAPVTPEQKTEEVNPQGAQQANVPPVNPTPQETPVQPNPVPQGMPYGQQIPPQGFPQGMPYQQPMMQPVAPKKSFKMTPQILIPIIAGVVVILAAILFVVIGKSTSNPKKVVEKYLEAVVDKDWEKAYDMLEVNESDFLNEEAYVKMMESKKGQTITNYKIYTDFSTIEKDAIATTVYYGYTVSGQSGEFNGELQLIKQKEKHMLFFERWEVSEKYAENSYVVAPEGTTVTVDDIELDPETAKEYDDTYVQYTIPTMFYGTHKVKSTSDIFEDVETEWTVDYSEAYCYVDRGEIKESVIEDLTTQIEEMVSEVYAKGYEGKDFSEISTYFSDDKSVQDSAKGYYDNMKDDFVVNESGEGFKKFSITDIEANLDYNSGTSCQFEVDFDFDYEKTELDWWTNEMKTKTGSSSEDLSVNVDLVDDEWIVTYIYIPSIYVY